MRIILKLFVYLWQLPQMLVGLLICNLIKDTQSFDATTKTAILLGWFYFIVVGIPSFVLNIIGRICKKDEQWYYNKFPENWANKLAEGITTIELK